ncbi:3-hydroxybutyrate dehydrogenase [Candidatus Obscuribacterales bacterium]|nr:3-hydroxybutyrate dehydrogenase [Candidatus Obscuribacterales bacterium]
MSQLEASATKEQHSKILDNKVAVVTGSTSGIGLGIARRLAANGCHIVLNGLADTAEVERVKTELAESSQRTIVYHGADMTKPQEIAELVEFAVNELGSVDILVNNAGIQHTASVEDFPVEKWDAVLAINLSSAFHTMRAALPHMKRNGFGRIVNIASVHGLVASAQKAAYVAAKHGLIGLTKVAALENAETGITVNAVCPGWVRTPLVEKQITDLAQRKGVSQEIAAEELLSAKQPSKRFVEVDELGDTVVFLASKAASNITGSSITVDGGWTAQ